ncbi:MAG TPA: VOC family protein [Gaiellaceae bacterium]|nr:VOC family protein [Gaiellaceae bacterium]
MGRLDRAADRGSSSSRTVSSSTASLVVTAADYDEAIRFYRDVLGLPEWAAFSSPEGLVTILDGGRATLELADPAHAEFVDAVEVGSRVAGHVRVAFEVDDVHTAMASVSEAPVQILAEPDAVRPGTRSTRVSKPLRAYS